MPDFHEWCHVTRHSRLFCGLTGCQRTPGFGALQIDRCVLFEVMNPKNLKMRAEIAPWKMRRELGVK